MGKLRRSGRVAEIKNKRISYLWRQSLTNIDIEHYMYVRSLTKQYFDIVWYFFMYIQ